MKNYIILFCLICIFCTIEANAQTYLISFAGSGESTTVTTVKVDNLTTGTSRTLNGSQILRLNVVITDINSGKNKQTTELKIYPNPMTDNSIMQVYPPMPGNTIISVSDINGKQITQIKSYLDNDLQEFRLSGFPIGFYLITVSSQAYLYSGKLISNGQSNGAISIEKISNNKQAVNKKIFENDSKGEPNYIDMPYTPGEILKYTSISGDYSTVRMDAPESDKTITFNFISLTDGDNNNYPVVEIGSQTWMAENLKTTKYQDGTSIPLIVNNADWGNLTTAGYCWYNNDETTYKPEYGALYNWYAVNSGEMCPTGWHVPSNVELLTLTAFLGGESVAGGKLKETGISSWISPNAGATNETGFTALPGDARYLDGTYKFFGTYCHFWSSTEDNSEKSWLLYLMNDWEGIANISADKNYGLSVRCLQNGLPTIATNSASSITNNTATSGGNITSDGGTPVIERGICWSISQNPTTSGSRTSDGTGMGTFTSSITGLIENKTYYLRAYAINDAGTVYGDEKTFSTPSKATDIEGNIYNTVTIGTQTWMAENLKTAKYRNGELIGTTTPATLDITSESTPKYQWAYDGDENNVAIKGRLYTFYAIKDSRGVCPTGWHIPSDEEWTTLTTYLGGEAIAGGKLKEIGTSHWAYPNTGATNETGFSAIPGGLRTYDGYFMIFGRWWSATEISPGLAYGRTMNYNNASVYRNMLDENYGISVRCINDN